MLPDRKLNRLNGFDYSKCRAYFVTICTRYHECVFGNIIEQMLLNKYGIIANECWLDIANHFSNCRVTEFVIMPNHLHGIVIINEDESNLETKHNLQQLPIIIGSYKSAVSKSIHQNGYTAFQWQKSYHDRIIRNDDESNRIADYIKNNPQQWKTDQFYKPVELKNNSTTMGLSQKVKK